MAFTCVAKIPNYVWSEGVFRRFTAVEYERLMGFGDGYTDIPYRGRPGAPDGLRMTALGNSWPVNVARFICQRIDKAIKCTLQ